MVMLLKQTCKEDGPVLSLGTVIVLLLCFLLKIQFYQFYPVVIKWEKGRPLFTISCKLENLTKDGSPRKNISLGKWSLLAEQLINDN